MRIIVAVYIADSAGRLTDLAFALFSRIGRCRTGSLLLQEGLHSRKRTH